MTEKSAFEQANEWKAKAKEAAEKTAIAFETMQTCRTELKSADKRVEDARKTAEETRQEERELSKELQKVDGGLAAFDKSFERFIQSSYSVYSPKPDASFIEKTRNLLAAAETASASSEKYEALKSKWSTCEQSATTFERAYKNAVSNAVGAKVEYQATCAAYVEQQEKEREISKNVVETVAKAMEETKRKQSELQSMLADDGDNVAAAAPLPQDKEGEKATK